MSKLQPLCLRTPDKVQQLRVKGMIVGVPQCDGSCGYADFKIKPFGHKFINYIHAAEYAIDSWRPKHE